MTTGMIIAITIVVAVVITLLIAVPITCRVAVANKVKKDAEITGTAEVKARNIIDEACKTAETKKREALLEAKEESLKTKNELERVEADGNIRILMSKGSPVGLAPKQNSGMAQASAEAFEYMKNGNILVLKGPHVITTSDGVLTAEQETRYFQDAQKSVSIGNVVIKQANNTLRADMMTAYYGKNNELKKVEATGNVKVVTPKGTAVGEKGIYTPNNAKVELIGKVQIEQQGNFINGDRAETDLNTQISKITGDKKTGGRISGTFYSKRKTENEQK